jgi:hypothetical protein
MGGRVSGESPREEKVEERNSSAGAVRPCQTEEDAGDAATAVFARQASGQQLAVCNPLGQHDSCEVSD